MKIDRLYLLETLLEGGRMHLSLQEGSDYLLFVRGKWILRNENGYELNSDLSRSEAQKLIQHRLEEEEADDAHRAGEIDWLEGEIQREREWKNK